MKDSGIKWVGMIPASWNVYPIYVNFEERKNENYKLQEQNLLSLSYGRIIRKNIKENGGLLPTSFDTYNIVEDGDIIIRPTDLQNDKKSLRTGLVQERGIITSAYIALKPKKGVNSEFFHYLLYAYDILKVFYNMGNGVRQGLNYNEFAKLLLVAPLPLEQNEIVSFLDKKCADIDALAADIQAEIDTLELYKKSIITEVVTQGLDKTVPMKDSGISWIGEIPIHWQVDKIKYHMRRCEQRNPGNKQILSVYREYGIIPKNSRTDNHNVTSEDTTKYKYVKPGYFVINKMKAWQGSMGVSKYEGVVSPAYFIYKFGSNVFIPMFVHYLLRTCYKDEFRRISGGIREGQWDLQPLAFESTKILVPPIAEQEKIISFIDAQCSEIDSIISQKQDQLSILEAYKKSLIYEYVTGKKEVPS